MIGCYRFSLAYARLRGSDLPGQKREAIFRMKNTFITETVTFTTSRNHSLFCFSLLMLCSLLPLQGCGDGFRGSESALPPDVERVFIPIVTNKSTQAGVDTLLTEALRDEFDRYGTITVVDRRSQADAVLDATITSITRERGPTTSNTDTALLLFTVMTLQAELRKKTGALLWKNDRMRVSKAFGAEGGVVVTSSADFASGNIGSSDFENLDDREVSRGQEQQALEDLSEQVARQIYAGAVLPEF